MLIPRPLKGESPQAFKAFKLYVELGDKRTFKEVARRLRCSCQNLTKFAMRWNWQDRLALLIAEEQERLIETERAAQLEHAKAREAMRLQHEMNVISFGDPIMAKLREFAAMPITQTTEVRRVRDEDTDQIIEQTFIVEPTTINWASFSKVFTDWDTRMRLVLGMPTTKHEVTGADGAPLGAASGGPLINLVITRDEHSDEARAMQKQFLETHPEHPQAQRFLREYNAEHDSGNGHS
jgi:hypothetical protein